jgi:hypothetical protein
MLLEKGEEGKSFWSAIFRPPKKLILVLIDFSLRERFRPYLFPGK